MTTNKVKDLANMTVDKNCWWNYVYGTLALMEDLSFTDWQDETGHDAHSKNTDPLV